jgi:hypothetical protein
MNEIRATPEQLRSAVYEALDRLSNLEQGQVDDEAERLSYRIAIVGFPLEESGESS